VNVVLCAFSDPGVGRDPQGTNDGKAPLQTKQHGEYTIRPPLNRAQLNSEDGVSVSWIV
jgi:hypothetical protein